MRFLRLSFVVLALCGCGKSEPPIVSSIGAADLDPEAAAEMEVTGVIDGERFTLRDAWFRVEHKEHRHRVDLVLSDGEGARLCSDAEPGKARHVWVRFPGVEKVAPGVYRGDAGDPEATIAGNYEASGEHGWRGRAGAVAIAIDDPGAAATPDAGVQSVPKVMAGRIRACFGPGQEGCVSGNFRARLCHTEFDLEGPFSERSGGVIDAEQHR